MNKTFSLLFILPLLCACSNVPSGNVSDSTNIQNTTTESNSLEELSTIEPTLQQPTSDEKPSINFEKKVDMTYTFTGDEKDKAGFAQGTIEITPTTSKRNYGYYLIYFANEYEVLNNYDELASIKITGEKVTYTIKDGHYIPYEASKLAVFESDKMFLNNVPNINDAADIIDIDENKTLLR